VKLGIVEKGTILPGEECSGSTLFISIALVEHWQKIDDRVEFSDLSEGPGTVLAGVG
jgi:hypothetical protein